MWNWNQWNDFTDIDLIVRHGVANGVELEHA